MSKNEGRQAGVTISIPIMYGTRARKINKSEASSFDSTHTHTWKVI